MMWKDTWQDEFTWSDTMTYNVPKIMRQDEFTGDDFTKHYVQFNVTDYDAPLMCTNVPLMCTKTQYILLLITTFQK